MREKSKKCACESSGVEIVFSDTYSKFVNSTRADGKQVPRRVIIHEKCGGELPEKAYPLNAT